MIHNIKIPETIKVFLGGTCNNSTWRDQLIPKLNIRYFNPVVSDWTPDCQKEELRQRKICDKCLYVITPRMKGAYSVAEVVDDSNKQPKDTVLCILKQDGSIGFDIGQWKSLQMVRNMVHNNGAMVCNTLDEVANYLNAV